MKKIIIVLSGFLSLWIGQVQAQLDDTKAHHRYWYYRHRLQNDFMVKNTVNPQGTNIPASIRGEYGDAVLKWGDATIDLGFYIGVLATEYKLLMDNGRNVEARFTLHDLRAALLALNRLDVEGDYQFGVIPGTHSLNGFMIRDDVPSGFLNTAGHQHLKGEADGGTPNAYPVTGIESNFTESSQRAVGADQMVYIFLGLSLVKEFIPPGTICPGFTFAPYDNSVTGIAEEAEMISERIWTRLCEDNWWLKDPATGSNIPAADGGYVGAWAVPISKICDIISPTNAPHLHTIINPVTIDQWHHLGETGGVWPSADKHMIAALGNMSNTFIPAVADVVAAGFGFEIMPLLRQAIFGGPSFIDNSNYENLISQAPCYGPYNWINVSPTYTIPGPAYPNSEWSSSQRWVHPERRHDVGDPNLWPGQYNGLDYMLLHNLFYIVTDGYTNAEQMANMWDENRSFPVGSLGTTSIPAQIDAYEIMYLTGMTVSPLTPTNVTCRAGYNIRMLSYPSDCSIRPTGTNAIFHAYIAPFTCDSYDNYHMMEHDTNSYVPENTYAQSHNEYLSAQATSIAKPEKLANITIAPNPSTGIFQISLFSLRSDSRLQNVVIYDLLGNEVWKANCENQDMFSIDLTTHAKGFYLLKLQSTTGQIQTEKIIYK